MRRDGFSRQYLVERISKQGFWVRTAPVSEWIKYCDYIVQHRLVAKSRWGDRLKNKITCMVKNPFEVEIRACLPIAVFTVYLIMMWNTW